MAGVNSATHSIWVFVTRLHMNKLDADIGDVEERYYGRLNPNSILGLITAALATFFLSYLVPNYIEEPGHLSNPMLSPRFIPVVAGWLVLTLSFVMATEGFFRPPKHTKAEKLHIGIPKLRWILMLVACSIYMFLFEQLGAIFCGALACFSLFAASNLREMWVYILGLIFPIIITLLFIHLLNVPLPAGMIWE